MKNIHFLLALLLPLAIAQNKSENTIDRESSALGYIAFPKVFDGILVDFLETPIQFRGILYLNFASWNAWCNYHPTAADIFGRTRFKRPVEEHTRQNKNIAALYAMWRLYQSSPQSFGGTRGLPLYRAAMEELGLDPDDMSTDLTTAIGIGNRAGMDTARLAKMDGWNSEGDLTAEQTNYKQPFQDPTGYCPKNNPWRIRFPFKWQPLLENNGLGFFFRQEFVTPQAGSSIAFSLSPREVRQREVSSPYRDGNANVTEALYSDLKKLKKDARQLLRISSKLSEKQRILAELFDNKAKAFRTKENPFGIAGIATAIRFLIIGPRLDLNLDEEMIYGMGSNIATFDAMVTVWKEKRRIDSIRPTGQTMEFLFGDKKFSVWGGPDKDNVMIKAGEWEPYIRTMPHGEFPSGSACACAAFVEHALVETKGRDDYELSFVVPKGSSKFYPGLVPEKDTKIVIRRLSDWSRLCSESRLFAGVHFRPSIEGGEKLCEGIGRGAHKFANELAGGKLNAKWMKWLPEDVEKFWEE